MAESPQKRLREEEEEEGEVEETKRHCSFHHILSLLESDEDDPTQEDLSSLITSLQQELSSPDPLSEPTPTDPPSSSSLPAPPPSALFKEEVLRHLLEASDDDLGIPQTETEGGGYEDSIGRWEVSTYGRIWELEDEAANYYTLLQSELFM